MPLRERLIDLGGIRHLVRDGGSGPAVILAHGMWCEGGMYDDVARRLLGSCRLVIPDFRAHGGTDVPADSWTVTDLAEDLIRLMDHLRIDRATIAGFSMGGMAAVHFAVRFPKRLKGLVLIGTSAGSEELVRVAQIRASIRLIQRIGLPGIGLREAVRRTFSAAFRRQEPVTVGRWEAATRAMPPDALVQALDAVASRPSLVSQLGAIRAPTVIMVGSADRVLRPRWSRVLRDRIAGARLQVLRGVGHAVPIERPAETAAAILEVAG